MLSTNTNFVYDGLNPVQELNGTTPTANLLTGGLDERFTRTDSSGTLDYLSDALGSTIELAASNGSSQVQYSYDPYGNMSINGDSNNSFGYTGREFDGLGINYYRARYYNPGSDRFLSEDPKGFQGGTNLYAYAGAAPTQYIDPLGTDRCQPNPVLVWLQVDQIGLQTLSLSFDIADGNLLGAYDAILTILANEVLLSAELDGNQSMNAAEEEASTLNSLSNPEGAVAYATSGSAGMSSDVATVVSDFGLSGELADFLKEGGGLLQSSAMSADLSSALLDIVQQPVRQSTCK